MRTLITSDCITVVSIMSINADCPSTNPLDEPVCLSKVNIGGPRLGFTGIVNNGSFRDELQKNGVNPLYSQFGWQFEFKVVPEGNGPSFVTEIIPMFGAVEYSTIIPSVTIPLGVRFPNGFEFSLGPNIALGWDKDKNNLTSTSSLVLAVGKTFSYRGVGIPVNLTVAQGKNSPSIITTNISIESDSAFTVDQPISIELPTSFQQKSLPTYSSENIKPLSDTLFSSSISKIGIYYPTAVASFSGQYIYTQTQRDFSKIPVLFVHGYGGSPREFYFLSHSLDTALYQPVFFHYPSGQSLEQTAKIFYEFIFSEKMISLQDQKMVIIAHSMGGLIARESINLYSQSNKQTIPIEFFTLSTPYGGIKSAAKSLKYAPVIVPAWKDLSVNSKFIKSILAYNLPINCNFYLLFSYKKQKAISLKSNSDGTIPLSSHLFELAQTVARETIGFNETHESILQSSSASSKINLILRTVNQ